MQLLYVNHLKKHRYVLRAQDDKKMYCSKGQFTSYINTDNLLGLLSVLSNQIELTTTNNQNVQIRKFCLITIIYNNLTQPRKIITFSF